MVSSMASFLQCIPSSPTTYKSSTLYPLQPEVRFHVTHPYSPDFGKEFVLIEKTICWDEDRLLCFDEQGNYRRILTSWTDFQPPKPFVAASAGRAYLTDSDAVELASLLVLLKDELSM